MWGSIAAVRAAFGSSWNSLRSALCVLLRLCASNEAPVPSPPKRLGIGVSLLGGHGLLLGRLDVETEEIVFPSGTVGVHRLRI